MKGVLKKWALFGAVFVSVSIGSEISLHLWLLKRLTLEEILLLSWIAFYIALKTTEEQK